MKMPVGKPGSSLTVDHLATSPSAMEMDRFRKILFEHSYTPPPIRRDRSRSPGYERQLEVRKSSHKEPTPSAAVRGQSNLDKRGDGRYSDIMGTLAYGAEDQKTIDSLSIQPPGVKIEQTPNEPCHITHATQNTATPAYHYATEEFNVAICNKSGGLDACSCAWANDDTKFEKEVAKRWSAMQKQKAVKYDLNLMYKLLPGHYGLTAQLNVERGVLRRRPLPFRSLREPFDSRRFNYNKIRQKEILFDLRCSDSRVGDTIDRHMVLVNSSPIERNHCLVIPSINRCLHQVMNRDAVRLMADIMLLCRNPRLHLLYNSLMAFASVNHLHFHMLFYPYTSPITKARVRPIHGLVNVIDAPDEWYCPAYVVQLLLREDLTRFVEAITSVIKYLHSHNVAHNIFMGRAHLLHHRRRSASQTDGDKCNTDNEDDGRATPPWERPPPHEPLYVTCYIFPRKPVPGAKPCVNFSPAAAELAGHLLVYNYKFFESMNEKWVMRMMQDDAIMPVDVYRSLEQSLTLYLKTGVMPPKDTDVELKSRRYSWSQSISGHHTTMLNENYLSFINDDDDHEEAI